MDSARTSDAALPWADHLGRRATLVQFSSTFCTPCRLTRQVLDRVVVTDPEVTHVELDVADHTELAERWDIRATPTVLVLDATGAEVGRHVGRPSLAQARAAVAPEAVPGPTR